MNSKVIITKAVLLSVAMAGVMTSCQKEEFQNEILVSQEMSQKNLAHQELTLRYWIDGVEYSKEFASQKEMDKFIKYLITLTREGITVIIQGSENPSYAPSENDKLTFTTKDEDKMVAWAFEMRTNGYDVSYTFDKETGLYTGTATKGGSRTMVVSLSEERE